MKKKNSLLPSNSSNLEHALEQVLFFAPNLTISDLWQANKCPANFLPALAWQYGDIYLDQDWNEQQQRQTIENSFKKHQKIGTRQTLINALAPFGKVLDIKEWFNDPFAPKATFSIDFALTEQGMNVNSYNQIITIINEVRPVAKHLTTLNINLAVYGKVYGALGIFNSETIKIYPKPITNLNPAFTPVIYTAADCSPAIIEVFPLN